MKRSRQRGNALLELAVVAPLLLTLLFGVIDFSRAFYLTEIAAGAARAGTQYAVLSTSNSTNTTGMRTAAINNAGSVGSANGFSATATNFCQCSGTTTNVSCSTTCGGQLWKYAKVDTQLTYTMFFKYVMLPASITVRGTSTLRVL
jgi:Flp pilus assembly protein TadG